MGFPIIAAVLATTSAQMAPPNPPKLPNPPKPGTVWVVDYVKVMPGRRAAFDDYRRSAWLPARLQAVKEGLIVSFKVLEAPAGAKLDYDLQLMTEFPLKESVAASEPRWQEILKSIAPNGPKVPDGLKNSDIRKIVRSVVLTTIEKG